MRRRHLTFQFSVFTFQFRYNIEISPPAMQEAILLCEYLVLESWFALGDKGCDHL